MFLVAANSEASVGPQVLLQHRASWTHSGGTWALPGGARDSHESPADAAIREAVEECQIDPNLVSVKHTEITAGPFPGDPARPELAGDWSYTTVVAVTTAGAPIPVVPNEESEDLQWVELSAVDTYALMPAFAEVYPHLREVAEAILSDTFSG